MPTCLQQRSQHRRHAGASCAGTPGAWELPGDDRGECIIHPGQENPAHSHPNCEEVLHLISGHITHTAGEEVYTLHPGDTITIPRGVRHNARNIGDVDAVMSIAYSSADRQMDPA